MAARSSRVAANAGARPNSTTTTSDVARVNDRMRQSRSRERSILPIAEERNETSDAAAAGATSSPRAAPAPPNTTLSVSSWRMSRHRLAPSDSRTAISRRRAPARASSRFATFTVAMTSNSATTVINTQSGAANRRLRSVRPPLASPTSTWSGCSNCHSALSCPAMRAMLARTWSSEAPGCRRAIVRNIIATLLRRYPSSNQVMGTRHPLPAR